MNWRRGLFRLWLLAAVLWVTALFAILRPDQLIQAPLPSDLANAERVATEEIAAKLGTPAPPPGIILAYDLEEIRKAVDGMRDANASDEEVNSDLADQGLTRAQYDAVQLVRLHRRLGDAMRAKLQEYAGLMLGVPLIVLAFGSALLWTLSGFRTVR